MTSKEKAKELLDKMENIALKHDCFGAEYLVAKECALIAVHELIIQNGELYLNGLNGAYYTEKNNFLFEVKQEIEKL
jgi:hypothetical protein